MLIVVRSTIKYCAQIVRVSREGVAPKRTLMYKRDGGQFTVLSGLRILLKTPHGSINPFLSSFLISALPEIIRLL